MLSKSELAMFARSDGKMDGDLLQGGQSRNSESTILGAKFSAGVTPLLSQRLLQHRMWPMVPTLGSATDLLSDFREVPRPVLHCEGVSPAMRPGRLKGARWAN